MTLYETKNYNFFFYKTCESYERIFWKLAVIKQGTKLMSPAPSTCDVLSQESGSQKWDAEMSKIDTLQPADPKMIETTKNGDDIIDIRHAVWHAICLTLMQDSRDWPGLGHGDMTSWHHLLAWISISTIPGDGKHRPGCHHTLAHVVKVHRIACQKPKVLFRTRGHGTPVLNRTYALQAHSFKSRQRPAPLTEPLFWSDG